MNKALIDIYSSQLGGELPYFTGNPNQWGGGILQTLARFAFPILKRLAGVAAHTAEDILFDNKSFKDSLIDNTMGEVSKIFTGNTATKRKRRTSSINRSKKSRNRQQQDALSKL